MRRQNPPQAYIERAKQIEGYLRKPVIASVYLSLGILYAVAVSAIFLSLVRLSMLRETNATIVVFAAVALIPAAMAVIGCFLSPHDPLSQWLIRMADKWRRPLDTPPELYTFRELLMNGEPACIKISFYYPVENQTAELKERLYTYVHAVLGKEFGSRAEVPSRLEIQNLIDSPTDILASECNIPVLYSEIDEAYQLQGAFDYTQSVLSPQYWSGLGA